MSATRYRCCVRRPDECPSTTITSGDAPIGWRNVVVGSKDLWFCPSHHDVAEYAAQLEKQLVARQTTIDEFLERAPQSRDARAELRDHDPGDEDRSGVRW